MTNQDWMQIAKALAHIPNLHRKIRELETKLVEKDKTFLKAENAWVAATQYDKQTYHDNLQHLNNRINELESELYELKQAKKAW